MLEWAGKVRRVGRRPQPCHLGEERRVLFTWGWGWGREEGLALAALQS